MVSMSDQKHGFRGERVICLPADLIKRSDSVLVISGDGGMAHPTGFEPVIPGFVDRCLIQFGHGCMSSFQRGQDYLEERMTSQGV